MIAVLLLLALFFPQSSVVFGHPESRFARVRELSGHKYQDDYKVFIDDTAIDIPAKKLQHPLFSWNVVPSSTEPDTISTSKPELGGKGLDNEQQDKGAQISERGKRRKNRNKNDLHVSDKNKTNRLYQLQQQTLELNVTNVNNKDSNPLQVLKGRRRKNRNRKNKQGHRKSKQGRNAGGKNKKHKSDRKVRRGHKQKHYISKNDLPDSDPSDKNQMHTTEHLQHFLSKTTGISNKVDDVFFAQIHPNVSVFLNTPKANETNYINEVDKNSLRITDSKVSDEGDNTLQPIHNTDLINHEYNAINVLQNASSSHYSSNGTVESRETESATVELDINQTSDTYVKFFDKNSTSSHQGSVDSGSRLDLENVNSPFQDHEEKEYDAMNEIVGDLSCLAGTFLPAPPSPHSAIRYVRTQTAQTANLVAEYECEPKYHLENTKVYQVICSERKWMGTVPTCITDLPPAENHATCHDGKGSCDHLCEIVGNNTICACYKGFRLENGVCQDINECEINNGGCERGCRNTPGSHHCTCPPGLRLGDNRVNCIDINECLLRNGHGPCQDLCRNKWGSYECSCTGITGTRLAADNHKCQDIDECADGTAGCSHTCLNTFGSAFCLCPSGFMLGDDWKTCQDIDECSYDELQSEQCEFGCVNTVGSYHCLGPQNDDSILSSTTEVLVGCPVGYYLDADGNCKDVDECKEKTSGCEQGCLNTKGGFQCYCGLGYKLAVDNKTCAEAKEAVCPPLESPLHGYWECARHLIRTKKSKLPWMKRNRVVNHAGAICQLKCPPGYVLEGEYRKTCGQDSKWKGPEDGTCVRKLDYKFNVILKA